MEIETVLGEAFSKFLTGIFNAGKAAGIEELTLKCIEQGIDDIPFPSRLMQNIADQIVGEEEK